MQSPPSDRMGQPDDWTRQRPEDTQLIHPLDPPTRAGRRLRVDQIRRSIPSLFGGITWNIGRRSIGFDRYARTLGEADYLEVTMENVDPSPLFSKFMDDMAGTVCKAVVDADMSNSVENQRHLIRYNDVAENLRFLRLKLHSLWVDPMETEGIDDLLDLHRQILVNSTEAQAWFGVCVAMLTAPEFLAY